MGATRGQLFKNRALCVWLLDIHVALSPFSSWRFFCANKQKVNVIGWCCQCLSPANQVAFFLPSGRQALIDHTLHRCLFLRHCLYKTVILFVSHSRFLGIFTTGLIFQNVTLVFATFDMFSEVVRTFKPFVAWYTYQMTSWLHHQK
jgi:hypothetical protein